MMISQTNPNVKSSWEKPEKISSLARVIRYLFLKSLEDTQEFPKLVNWRYGSYGTSYSVAASQGIKLNPMALFNKYTPTESLGQLTALVARKMDEELGLLLSGEVSTDDFVRLGLQRVRQYSYKICASYGLPKLHPVLDKKIRGFVKILNDHENGLVRIGHKGRRATKTLGSQPFADVGAVKKLTDAVLACQVIQPLLKIFDRMTSNRGCGKERRVRSLVRRWLHTRILDNKLSIEKQMLDLLAFVRDTLSEDISAMSDAFLSFEHASGRMQATNKNNANEPGERALTLSLSHGSFDNLIEKEKFEDAKNLTTEVGWEPNLPLLLMTECGFSGLEGQTHPGHPPVDSSAPPLEEMSHEERAKILEDALKKYKLPSDFFSSDEEKPPKVLRSRTPEERAAYLEELRVDAGREEVNPNVPRIPR